MACILFANANCCSRIIGSATQFINYRFDLQDRGRHLWRIFGQRRKIEKSMRTLFLLRHAKSDWSNAALADFDRPLNDRGLRTAPFMGELMARKNIHPDLIISSPAERAMRTALLVKESSGSNCAINYDERIYDASPQALRTVISQISDGVHSALIVGHNPGMEGIIRYLTGDSEPMPTAALASITLEIKSWRDVTDNCGKLEYIVRPKEEMKRLNQTG